MSADKIQPEPVEALEPDEQAVEAHKPDEQAVEALEAELEPDERAVLEAMAAFKAGAVSDVHVRNTVRALLKMADDRGVPGRADFIPDELGVVEDTPEGVLIAPARGVDRYIVVPTERPDAEGKTGLMLRHPLSAPTAMPVYSPHEIEGNVRLERAPEPGSSVSYSVVAGAEARVKDLELRLDQIDTEIHESVSKEHRKDLRAERNRVETELAGLRVPRGA